MGMATTQANQLLGNLCGKLSTIDIGSVCYIGLLSSGGVEPNAETTGYKRQIIGNASQPDSQYMATASNKSITNSKAISFPVAEANWDVTVTQFALYRSLTATEPFFTGNLTASVSVLRDYIATFVPGSLTISVA